LSVQAEYPGNGMNVVSEGEILERITSVKVQDHQGMVVSNVQVDTMKYEKIAREYMTTQYVKEMAGKTACSPLDKSKIDTDCWARDILVSGQSKLHHQHQDEGVRTVSIQEDKPAPGHSSPEVKGTVKETPGKEINILLLTSFVQGSNSMGELPHRVQQHPGGQHERQEARAHHRHEGGDQEGGEGVVQLGELQQVHQVRGEGGTEEHAQVQLQVGPGHDQRLVQGAEHVQHCVQGAGGVGGAHDHGQRDEGHHHGQQHAQGAKNQEGVQAAQVGDGFQQEFRKVVRARRKKVPDGLVQHRIANFLSRFPNLGEGTKNSNTNYNLGMKRKNNEPEVNLRKMKFKANLAFSSDSD
jgi:hypothetical protein